MNRVKLGRTGFDVSVMGMGAGGPSQIGKKQGKTPEHAAAILLEAFEAGVNFVDTAEGYGTEHLVGLALKDFVEAGSQDGTFTLYCRTVKEKGGKSLFEETSSEEEETAGALRRGGRRGSRTDSAREEDTGAGAAARLLMGLDGF